MRKRFYIMLVARNSEGELLKIPIPLHYAYVFIAGALIGMLTITGMAGSYTRMLVKTQKFNQLRTEKEALRSQYSQLEQIAQENQLQAQSLTSLAGKFRDSCERKRKGSSCGRVSRSMRPVLL